jgi:hypothetical protein
MRGACKGEHIKNVPWLRAGKDYFEGAPSPENNAQAFGNRTAERVKKALGELGLSEDGEGREEWKTEVYHY